jgi:hypothetical protein
MVVIACMRSPEPAVLRDPDPAVCRFTTAFIRLEDKQVDYRLNGRAGYDSTAIARFFTSYFVKRPDSTRVVVIEADSGRKAELSWLLTEVARAHGKAYRSFDRNCRLELPDQSRSRPVM